MGLVTLQEGVGLEGHVGREGTCEFPILPSLVIGRGGSGGCGTSDAVREGLT